MCRPNRSRKIGATPQTAITNAPGTQSPEPWSVALAIVPARSARPGIGGTNRIYARLANLLTAQGLMENLLVQTLTQHNVSRECRKTKIQTNFARRKVCAVQACKAPPSAPSYRKLGYVARREDSHPTSSRCRLSRRAPT